MLEASGLLPQSCKLDIGALSRLFDDTTNSYKHLFFEALLEAFREGGFTERVFQLEDLAIGMLVAAWYPSRVFHLTLGSRDQVSEILAGLKIDEDGAIASSQLKAILKLSNPDYQKLMRFVPYRLIAPFFAHQLRGTPDHRRHAIIRSLADELFETTRPLYRFASADKIELHPDWVTYLAANFPIVTAWAERRWIAFLQARNPTVPAVSEKTRRPEQRNALTNQIRYWKKIISAKSTPLRCLYSGNLLDISCFHLDHFLPWTFVCHDAIWNLLPVSPEANLSKGNRLPHSSYIPALAAAQHEGLTIARRVMHLDEWEIMTASFIGDLRIPQGKLIDSRALLDAYDQLVGAQLSIAQAIGFEGGWRYTTRRSV